MAEEQPERTESEKQVDRAADTITQTKDCGCACKCTSAVEWREFLSSVSLPGVRYTVDGSIGLIRR